MSYIDRVVRGDVASVFFPVFYLQLRIFELSGSTQLYHTEVLMGCL